MEIFILLESLIIVFVAIALVILGQLDYKKYREEGLTFWEAYQRQWESDFPVIVIGMLFIFLLIVLRMI